MIDKFTRLDLSRCACRDASDRKLPRTFLCLCLLAVTFAAFPSDDRFVIGAWKTSQRRASETFTALHQLGSVDPHFDVQGVR